MRIGSIMSADDAEENHLEHTLTQTGSGHTKSSELASDIGQIQSSKCIVDGDGNDRGIVDIKRALFDALL